MTSKAKQKRTVSSLRHGIVSGLYSGVAWGFLMWFVIWRTQEMSIFLMIGGTVLFGAAIGSLNAWQHYRQKRINQQKDN